MGEHFLSDKEASDLKKTLKKAKASGATSGGVFGSIISS